MYYANAGGYSYGPTSVMPQPAPFQAPASSTYINPSYTAPAPTYYVQQPQQQPSYQPQQPDQGYGLSQYASVPTASYVQYSSTSAPRPQQQFTSTVGSNAWPAVSMASVPQATTVTEPKALVDSQQPISPPVTSAPAFPATAAPTTTTSTTDPMPASNSGIGGADAKTIASHSQIFTQRIQQQLQARQQAMQPVTTTVSTKPAAMVDQPQPQRVQAVAPQPGPQTSGDILPSGLAQDWKVEEVTVAQPQVQLHAQPASAQHRWAQSLAMEAQPQPQYPPPTSSSATRGAPSRGVTQVHRGPAVSVNSPVAKQPPSQENTSPSAAAIGATLDFPGKPISPIDRPTSPSPLRPALAATNRPSMPYRAETPPATTSPPGYTTGKRSSADAGQPPAPVPSASPTPQKTNYYPQVSSQAPPTTVVGQNRSTPRMSQAFPSGGAGATQARKPTQPRNQDHLEMLKKYNPDGQSIEATNVSVVTATPAPTSSPPGIHNPSAGPQRQVGSKIGGKATAPYVASQQATVGSRYSTAAHPVKPSSNSIPSRSATTATRPTAPAVATTPPTHQHTLHQRSQTGPTHRVVHSHQHDVKPPVSNVSTPGQDAPPDFYPDLSPKKQRKPLTFVSPTEAVFTETNPAIRARGPEGSVSHWSVGVDIGSNACRVAAVNPNLAFPRTVCNAISKEQTPTVVALRADRGHRAFGDPAKDQLIAKPTQAFNRLKRLLTLEESSTGNDLEGLNFEVLRDPTRVPVHLTSEEEPAADLLPQQLLSMLVAHLLGSVSRELGASSSSESTVELPHNVVFSTPPCFTEKQRSAVKEAGVIAGIPADRLTVIPDTLALLLNYRYVHYNDLPEGVTNDDYELVLFVDVGHEFSSACLCAVSKRQVAILHTCCAPMGAFSVDLNLFRMVSGWVREKHHCDISDKPKAIARLLRQCARVKETLSGLEKTFLTCEPLIDEIDVNFPIERTTIQECAEPLVSVVLQLMADVVNASNVQRGDIDRIELTGGGQRIPLLQQKLRAEWAPTPAPGASNSVPVHTTLDSALAICQGCALLGVAKPLKPEQLSSAVETDEASAMRWRHSVNLSPAVPLPIDTSLLSPEAHIEAMRQTEQTLRIRDEAFVTKSLAQNALEEYIFSLRNIVNNPELQHLNMVALGFVLDEYEEKLSDSNGSLPLESVNKMMADLQEEFKTRFAYIGDELERQKQEKLRVEKEQQEKLQQEHQAQLEAEAAANAPESASLDPSMLSPGQPETSCAASQPASPMPIPNSQPYSYCSPETRRNGAEPTSTSNAQSRSPPSAASASQATQPSATSSMVPSPYSINFSPAPDAPMSAPRPSMRATPASSSVPASIPNGRAATRPSLGASIVKPTTDDGRMSTAQELRSRGDTCFRAQQWTDSITFYSQALAFLGEMRSHRFRQQQDDLAFILNLNLALAYEQTGHYSRAVQYAQAASLSRPSVAQPYLVHGRALLAMQNIDEGTMVLKKAHKLATGQHDDATLNELDALYRTYSKKLQAKPVMSGASSRFAPRNSNGETLISAAAGKEKCTIS